MEILHLSDLHFGETETSDGKVFGHVFKDDNGETDPKELADSLIGYYEKENAEPDYMVVSGDLVWTGITKEYNYALSFFERIKEKWTELSVVLVPGNHDLCRAYEAGEKQKDYISFVLNMKEKNLIGNKVDYPFLKICKDRSDIISYAFDKDKNFLIVGVNSAANIGDKSGSKKVAINKSSIKSIDQYMKANNIDGNVAKILVLHHHLFPLDEDAHLTAYSPNHTDSLDQTVISNTAKIQSWLSKNNFYIALHGHKHVPHGRKDTLWNSNTGDNGSQIVIAAAGSAGSDYHHINHGEQLSFNRVFIEKVSDSLWDVDVSVQGITHDLSTEINDLYSYSSQVGVHNQEQPYIFQIDDMSFCYENMMRRLKDNNDSLYNFCSISGSGGYRHPENMEVSGKRIDSDAIHKSFEALHPEYSKSSDWKDIDNLQRYFDGSGARFQFSHGARLFKKGVMGFGDNISPTSPIGKAIEALTSGGNSRAYVGMFDPSIDVFSEREEPLPGLMSFQFVKKGKYGDKTIVDIIATFRKLELSFWWVVNMYEAIKLLDYVVDRATKEDRGNDYSSGRVIFFSSIAQVKKNPEPLFVADIDMHENKKVADLLLQEEFIDLRNDLEQKKERTNENSIDYTGISRLSDTLEAFILYKDRSDLFDVHNIIKNCCSKLKEAVHTPEKARRYDLMEGAKECLTEAIEKLGKR